jgi:dihydrolipoamide dehydrogenase
LAAAPLTHAYLQVFRGHASFLDPHSLAVRDPASGAVVSTVHAKQFILATGSKPREHPTVKVDGEYILTSDHIASLRRFPDSMVILGAGVIGCEYATIFSKFKQTKVYLIDKAERILPFEDIDISARAAMSLKRRDVVLHSGCTLDSMVVRDGMVEYVVVDSQSKAKKTMRVDRALLSIGRVPNVDGLELQRAGVELTPKGLIAVHDVVGTSQPHIAAVGDVTADLSLVNVGEIEARYAVHRFFSQSKRQPSFVDQAGKFVYENVSSIMFLDPEIAAVGLNETMAQRAGIAYRAAVYDFAMVSRAIAMRNTQGCIKLLVTNDSEMRILGIRAAGPHASSLIEVVSLMVRSRRSIADLSELLTAYPSVTEGLQECVRLLLGSSIMKPLAFPRHLRVYEWKEGMPKTTIAD